MKRKSLAGLVFVLLLMLLLVVGCSNDEKPSGGEKEDDKVTEEGAKELSLEPMTTEDITLTYASWANGALNQELANKFMELYPNITVELVQLEQEGWNDHLTNLASTGELPDVFWYLGNVDIAVRNSWLGDMTEYFENDPESETVLSTLKDQGYFDGERKLAAPVAYQPYTIFLDENLFNKMNKDMPSADWTYSEMIDLMKEMTVPEQGIYGYNSYTKY